MFTAKDYLSMTRDIAAYSSQLRALAPEAMAGFHAMAKGAGQAGVLDAKSKELIALAIGVTQRCDGCIGFHAKALGALRASREEVGEALAMCLYMGGGPTLMYAADALRAFDRFSAPAPLDA